MMKLPWDVYQIGSLESTGRKARNLGAKCELSNNIRHCSLGMGNEKALRSPLFWVHLFAAKLPSGDSILETHEI